jgi:hypothetical protein
MLKAFLAATLVSAATMLSVAGDARADHRFRRFDPFQVFIDDNDFEDVDPDTDVSISDPDEDEILVPRRTERPRAARDRRDWVYDEEADEFYYRPQLKKQKSKKKIAKAKATKPAFTTRRTLTDAEKRQVAAITGKPNVAVPKFAKPQVQKVSVAKPVVVKPVAPKPAVKIAAPIKPVVPAPVVPAPVVPAPVVKASVVKTPARLVLPPEPAPKTSRLTPITPQQSAISCDKAAGIVTGFGFTSVSPQLCVGKTYAFKAMRDGKQFEVRISSANGELTEVRKL